MDTTPLDEYQAALRHLDTVASRGRQTDTTAQLRASIAAADAHVERGLAALATLQR
jgi:hypothetical protein